MPYQRSFDMPPETPPAPCMHLRSKAIYVTGNPDPNDPHDEGSHQYNCWCNLTQHVLGPDEALVSRYDCIMGRGCCQTR